MASKFAYDTGRELLMLLNKRNGPEERQVLSLLDEYFYGSWEKATTFIMDEPDAENSYFQQLGKRSFEPIITALRQMIQEGQEAAEQMKAQRDKEAKEAYLNLPNDPFQD